MTDRVDAVVVGSGPNGLAAAVTLALKGLEVHVFEAAGTVGGGTRTAELTVEGVRHDVCSAVHPLGVASPFLRSLPLDEHGLTWSWPEIDLAHPLDDGTAGVLSRDMGMTAASLGPDADRWQRLFGPFATRFDELMVDLLGPIARVPHHPVALGRFGVRAVQPATRLTEGFGAEPARALFTGSAAHLTGPLDKLGSAAVGILLTAAGHAAGWPVAIGGSASITNALTSLLVSLGGQVTTGFEVRSMADLPECDLVVFDTSPQAAVRIAGDRLGPGVRRSLGRWRYGPAAWKVDLAVEGGIPWTAEACRHAGTVHVGGTAAEIVHAETEVSGGRATDRPFVLVAQQYLADPSRSRGNLHPVWAYAHVPHGYGGDATEALLNQIERFAPGFRDRIVATHVTGPAALEAYNPNYVGGDIATGANSLGQLLARPRLTTHPYRLSDDGLYLCSAATPPGAGVHGMCGHLAARAALADLHRRR